MSITTIYHVEVEIPFDLYERVGHTPAYERASIEASKGSLSAGSNAYSHVYEWADFHSLKEAQECERRILAMIEQFR